jgi:hypothetical protein
MSLIITALRVLAMTLLLLISALCLSISIGMIAGIPHDRSMMKQNAARFEAAGEYVRKFHSANGAYPTATQLRAWATQRGYGDWAQQINGDLRGGSSAICFQQSDYRVLPSDTYFLIRLGRKWSDGDD